MADIQFTKMHGIGNDYVYINCMKSMPDNLPSLAIRMSDRHKGIGADGIILILPDDNADCMMRIFNADGSEAQMCGNGIRCVGKYVYDNGLVNSTTITVNTLAGIKTLEMRPGDDGKIATVTVDMGLPELEAELIPAAGQGTIVESDIEVDNTLYKITAVSMGNPHGVIFTNEITDAMVHGHGPLLEVHKLWPERANIEFVRQVDRHTVAMRVWERGSGETMACGTGACATAVAAVLTGRCDWPVTVRLSGGDLTIGRDPSSGHILMTGPATTVFTGIWPEEDDTAPRR